MRWLVLLLLAGCTSDGTCVVGVAEDCQSGDDSSTASPTFHRYNASSVVTSGLDALVSLTGSEDGRPDELVLVRVNLWSRETSELMVLGPGSRSTLAGTPDHAYLTWIHELHHYGALVDATGQLGIPFDFGTGEIQAVAVGSRFLVTDRGTPTVARWIEADGSVSDLVELTTSADEWAEVAASETTVGLAYRRGDALYARSLDDGVERTISQTKPDWFSIAVVGRTLYVVYKSTAAGSYDTHVIRCDPAGQTVEHVVRGASEGKTSLLAARSRVFAILPHTPIPGASIDFFEIELDGSVTSPGGSYSTLYEARIAAVAGDDLLAIEEDDHQATSVVLIDGNPHNPIVIAEGYEVGGCSVGANQGWLGVVALAGLSRCLRRPSRSRRRSLCGCG